MKRFNKFLDIIIILGSGFMFINYFSYLIKLFIWSEGLLPYIIAFAVVIFLPLAVYLHRKGFLGRLFGKLYPFFRSIYAVGLTFYAVSFIILCGYIFAQSYSAPNVSELPENTYVITLGAKVRADGQPGRILAKRLNTTYELLSEREDLICIVSGAKGNDEPMTEARCMKDYLVKRGIDEDRIIMEDQAHNTIENIRNSLRIIEDNGGCGGIAVVTTNFHLPRAEYLCARLGADMDKAYFYSAPDTGIYTLYTILVREYMSYLKLFVFGV